MVKVELSKEIVTRIIYGLPLKTVTIEELRRLREEYPNQIIRLADEIEVIEIRMALGGHLLILYRGGDRDQWKKWEECEDDN